MNPRLPGALASVSASPVLWCFWPDIRCRRNVQSCRVDGASLWNVVLSLWRRPIPALVVCQGMPLPAVKSFGFGFTFPARFGSDERFGCSEHNVFAVLLHDEFFKALEEYLPTCNSGPWRTSCWTRGWRVLLFNVPTIILDGPKMASRDWKSNRIGSQTLYYYLYNVCPYLQIWFRFFNSTQQIVEIVWKYHKFTHTLFVSNSARGYNPRCENRRLGSTTDCMIIVSGSAFARCTQLFEVRTMMKHEQSL